MGSRIGFAGLLLLGTLAQEAEAQSSFVRPLWRAESNQVGAGFGSVVAAAGDVNGDGYGDILVGAYSFNGDLNDEGSASVFHGSPDGPSKVPDWRAEGDQTSAYFGEAAAAAGDVNGDGFDDVIVGVARAGRASVYLGSLAGLAASPAWTGQTGDADLGWSVASAGDVNGDGFDDVLVSTHGYSNGQVNEGRVYLFPGSPAGPSLDPAWAVESDRNHSWFGFWVAAAGDVNGDGFGDVIVGAPRFSNAHFEEGRAYVYLGSAAGLATSAAWIAESNQSGALFGHWVSSAGDVNGDGYDDVIVSANVFSNGQEAEGGAFVYLGSPAGLSPAQAWTTESNQANAIAGAVSACDLDGDGYGDVLVGYYAFDRDQRNEGTVLAFFGSPSGLGTRAGWFVDGHQKDCMFGYSLAGAGDVNGDGFDDVIVGSYRFDNPQRDEGLARVYLGSSRRRLQ